jgi:hypothetical protein
MMKPAGIIRKLVQTRLETHTAKAIRKVVQKNINKRFPLRIHA